MTSIPRIDIGSYFMPLGKTWVSEPVGRYLGPGYSDYYFQGSLVRVMLEYSLICHSFDRVNFSCIARCECSSTRFFQFPGSVPFLMCYTVDNVSSNTTW